MSYTEFDKLTDERMSLEKEMAALDMMSHREDISFREAQIEKRLREIQARLDELKTASNNSA
ncbi:hypothetical protein SAMN04488527_15712 [Aliiroseovarius crassostreae]|uniref:Uncharacterized protein n=1 Tax=Aliiroseovarius crassostreae TaxID=154981 RepID=A0A0P7IGJ6_9RHOB|nr:hypothetical protein [Aliiroseovarius crassostreae]KPN62985.1 hypothetical protein AKJ29_02215 [Aliiroseovarius crassostreae]SFU96711.1 hypothetical protein SAMN04488527_15712 [Aliiroseovarius crassostreae]